MAPGRVLPILGESKVLEIVIGKKSHLEMALMCCLILIIVVSASLHHSKEVPLFTIA